MPPHHQSRQISYQLAHISGMGPILNIFRVTPLNRSISAIFGAFFVIGAGLSITYGIYDLIVKIALFGLSINAITFFIALLIALGLFIPGSLSSANAIANWNKVVAVYSDGIAHSDIQGNQIWKWRDIKWFTISITKNCINGIHLKTTYLYTLQSKNGSILKLDNCIEKINDLGKVIEENIFPYQYASLHNQIQNGQTIKLGIVTINKDSLTVHKKAYNWNEIEYIEVKNGYIKIVKNLKSWFGDQKEPISAIPNVTPLLTIISQNTKVIIE